MTSVVAMRCEKKYSSDSWLLVMNMFNTEVSVGQGEKASAPNSEALGYDMYFEHKFDGTIKTIWYQKGDSPILVQIKASAINAFQTNIVKPTEKKTFTIHDPSGQYEAVVQGQLDGSLKISKTMNQETFMKFSDSNVKKENLELTGQTVTFVKNEGWVSSASVQQLVVVKNMRKFSAGAETFYPTSNEDTKGFDMNFGSNGILTVTETQATNINRPNGIFKNFNDFENYTQTTLGQFGEDVVQMIYNGLNEIDVLNTANSTLKEILSEKSVGKRYLKIHKLIDLLKNSKEGEITKIYVPRLSEIEKYGPKDVDILLFSLAQLVTEKSVEAKNLFLKYGLRAKNEKNKLQAVFASGYIKQAPAEILETLKIIFYTKKFSVDLQNSAILSIGSIVSSLKSETFLRKEYSEFLLDTLSYEFSEKKPGKSVVHILYSIYNSGVKISRDMYEKVKNSGDDNVRYVMSILTREIVLPDGDPDFPYSKEITKNFTIGGSEISAVFEGELFAGTNLDCKHPTFNYKLLAQVEGKAKILGIEQQFMIAKAVYGQKNGAELENEILLSIFGKVLYEKKIPSIDCIEHKYNLYHSAPGIRLSYILWISIVPVKFSVAADLKLNLDWGWNLCPRELSAMVELIPSAALEISGDVNIDLFIVRAGIELVADFGPVEIIPQAKVTGTLCEIGFDVKLDIPNAITANLESYYQFKKCKFLIFDCHWKDRNQKVWWHYQLPGMQKTLYDKEWKILGE